MVGIRVQRGRRPFMAAAIGLVLAGFLSDGTGRGFCGGIGSNGGRSAPLVREPVAIDMGPGCGAIV